MMAQVLEPLSPTGDSGVLGFCLPPDLVWQLWSNGKHLSHLPSLCLSNRSVKVQDLGDPKSYLGKSMNIYVCDHINMCVVICNCKP